MYKILQSFILNKNSHFNYPTFYLRAIFGHTMYIFLSAFYFNPVQCLNNEGVYENVVKFNCSLTWEWFDESRIKS